MNPIVGSIVALVTPMHEDGSVDYAALRSLIDWHIAEGTDCIGVVGTTGESPTVERRGTLRDHSRRRCEQAAGRVPIMAGAAPTPPPRRSNCRALPSRSAPIARLQVVPYYNSPTQEGIYQHFRAIAEAVDDLPMVLYNVPGRTVADMQHDTVLRLAQVPGIVGIKEATGNIERAAWLIKRRAEGFRRVFGRRPHRRRADAAAVARAMSASRANVAPRLMHELCVAALEGHLRRAVEIHMRLLPLHRELFCEPSPAPTKWALSQLGRCGPASRLPILPLTDDGQVRVARALNQSGLR